MSQPLRKYAYELALRLGMLAGYLMENMSIIELYDWMELDSVYCDDSWYQHATLCHKIDNIIGAKTKLDDYLPIKPVKSSKPKTRIQLEMNWMINANKIIRRGDK
jgi:hypothetical protein